MDAWALPVDACGILVPSRLCRRRLHPAIDELPTDEAGYEVAGVHPSGFIHAAVDLVSTPARSRSAILMTTPATTASTAGCTLPQPDINQPATNRRQSADERGRPASSRQQSTLKGE